MFPCKFSFQKSGIHAFRIYLYWYIACSRGGVFVVIRVEKLVHSILKPIPERGLTIEKFFILKSGSSLHTQKLGTLWGLGIHEQFILQSVLVLIYFVTFSRRYRRDWLLSVMALDFYLHIFRLFERRLMLLDYIDICYFQERDLAFQVFYGLIQFLVTEPLLAYLLF